MKTRVTWDALLAMRRELRLQRNFLKEISRIFCEHYRALNEKAYTTDNALRQMYVVREFRSSTQYLIAENCIGDGFRRRVAELLGDELEQIAAAYIERYEMEERLD